MNKNVLLLPALAFLILFLGMLYFDNADNITGAAVTGTIEERLFSSFYSIEPSFKVHVDYDLDEYDELRKKAEELLKCKDEKQLEKCINEKKSVFNDKNLGFELDEACDSKEKEALLDFTEYFESCVSSEIPIRSEKKPGEKILGCICKNKPEGDFKLQEKDGKVTITGDNNNKISIDFKNPNVKIEDVLNIEEDIFLHKGTIENSEQTKIIDSKVKHTDACNYKPKTKYRFCIKNKDNIFYKFTLQFKEQKIEQNPEETEEDLDELLEKNKEKLEEKLLVIYIECENSEDKIIDIGDKLLNTIFLKYIQQRVLLKTCEDNQNLIPNFMASLSTQTNSISIIISPGNIQEITYKNIEEDNKAETLATFISAELNKAEADESTYSIEEITTQFDNTIKITFDESKIEHKINQYTNSIALGIVKYAENTATP